MKKILVFLDNFDTGGVTSVVRSIYQNLDTSTFSMDFARRETSIGAFDHEIITKGDYIYYFRDCGLNKIPVWNYIHRQLYVARQIIIQVKKREIQYDAIHIHANPIIGLYIGVKLNIPIRIMHAHEAIPDFGDNVYRSKILGLIWKRRVRKYNQWSTIKAGDTLKACVAKYGENVIVDPLMRVLYPPVDMCRFSPDAYLDEDIREKYKIDKNKFNMIHVGRLNPIKNQKFMIDILSYILNERQTHLYIVGEGNEKDSLIAYAEQKGVIENLTILPADTTPGLYKLMNCSLLPSLSEAFGMVAVDSQLMGVPCFVSTNVPEDVDIGICTFLDLKNGAEEWAKEIICYDYSSLQIDYERKKMFDIKELLNILSKLYSGDK